MIARVSVAKRWIVAIRKRRKLMGRRDQSRISRTKRPIRSMAGRWDLDERSRKWRRRWTRSIRGERLTTILMAKKWVLLVDERRRRRETMVLSVRESVKV